MGDNHKIMNAVSANLPKKVKELARTSILSGEEGVELLNNAAWHGFYDIAQELLDAGVPANQKSARMAERRGYEGVAGLIRDRIREVARRR